MTAASPILLATSVAPGPRLATQRAAIESWLANGFEVVSLNAPEEIEALAGAIPGIQFVPAERTAKLLTGAPHVFVSDILRFLHQMDREVVGIVNSDIHMDPNPALAPFLAEHARDGLLYGPRLDVTDQGERTGQVNPTGFDLFFFPGDARGWWADTRFCLGQDYWDHWFPLMPLLQGRAVAKLLPPVGRHVAHETRRDGSFFLFADEFATLVSGYLSAPGSDAGGFGSGFRGGDFATLRQEAADTETAGLTGDERNHRLEAYARYIDDLSRYVIRYLDGNSARIAAPAG